MIVSKFLRTLPAVFLVGGVLAQIPSAPTASSGNVSDSVVKAVPAQAPKPTTDSVDRARGPEVPFVVRASAPIGAVVQLAGKSVNVDSSGKFVLDVKMDSVTRANGSLDLCLLVGGQTACSPLRPQGFDTLDIAPLAMKIDSVVETRDTLVNVVDTTGQIDSAAIAAEAGALLVKGSNAGRTVTVRGRRRPPRMVGQERVSVQTIKRLPGLAEPDVIRAVQALPGVVASSDFSTKIYVRGSSSDQNLVLFDNAVVYSPSHFGGIFSSFLADGVGGLDFYKGGFEPRYGNRLSSVLLVTSKKGGSEQPDTLSGLEKQLNNWLPDSLKDSTQPARFNGSARITGLTVLPISASLALDGQIGEVSWAVAGRRTAIDYALAALRKTKITDFDLDYSFYDEQGNLAWGRDGDSIKISLYQGRDKLNFGPITLDWGNLAVPVNVKKRLADQLTFNGTLAWSKFDQTVRFGDILQLDNAVGTLNARAELQYDPVPEHRLQLGYELNTFDVLFRQNIVVAEVDLREQNDNMVHAGYLQDRWVVNPEITLNGGVRGYWSRELERADFDPRATLTWRFAPDWKSDFHVGRYSQYLTSLRFNDQETFNEFWYAARKPMKPTFQNMAVAGVERSNWGDLGLRTNLEMYYKQVKNIPLFFPNQTSNELKSYDDQGKEYFPNSFQFLDGYALGGEISVQKEDGWWTGGLSYGFSMAALQQQPFTNELFKNKTFDPYWADWDQRNTFKGNLALNWKGSKDDALWQHKKKGRYFRSSLQANFNTGLPYTEYEGYYRTHEPMQGVDGGQTAGPPVYNDGNTNVVLGERNRARKPYYFRLDMTPVDIGRVGEWRFYWTIVNVTNRENLFLVNYDKATNPPKRDDVYQFPFLPLFFGFEYEF